MGHQPALVVVSLRHHGTACWQGQLSDAPNIDLVDLSAAPVARFEHRRRR